MLQKFEPLLFHKILVWFWAAWWLIALWTDITGSLAHVGILQATWAPDTNYPFLVSSLKKFALPAWLPAVLFGGIIVWLAIATLAFCWAGVASGKSRHLWYIRTRFAYVISLSCWLVFFLADQLVMDFALEQNHIVQGGFELLCFWGFLLFTKKPAAT